MDRLCDDKLERAGFATRLAADILSWHGKDSLVISINGEWGCGKTSLKNFITQCLNEKGDPIVIEFNPWEWSGQDKLLEGFFGTVRARFKMTDAVADTKKLAERWERFESWTKFGAEISDQVSKALAPLFGGSVTVALLANNASPAWLRTTGISLGLTGVVISTFLAIFPGIAGRYIECLKTKAGHGKRTVSQLRKDIGNELAKLRTRKRPVVVIIDDIDRLNAEEIRFLFQLVKVNADFPNLVYLLLFQKDIVTRALAEADLGTGADYLKKIVQVEFDVPQASRALMLNLFQEGLAKIVDRPGITHRWDKERIVDVFEDDLWPQFQTLRDVRRFLGTFAFYFDGQVNHEVLEVNPVDLLIIEVLRTFDHQSYLAIRESLSYPKQKGIALLLFGSAERKKKIQIEIDAIVNRPGLSDAQKGQLRSILRALFPDQHDGEFMAAAERDLRICHPSHFPKYFEHSLDETATSAANIQALLRLVRRRPEFTARLRDLCQTGNVEEVLKKIALYLDEIPADAAESFIGAIFDVGEELPEASVGMLTRELPFQAVRMIYWFLRKLPNNAARNSVLVQCLASSAGVVAPTLLIALLEPGQDQNERHPRLLDEEDHSRLRQTVLARIKALASSGAIWQSQYFTTYIYRWRDWAGQEDVNTWLRQAFSTPSRNLEFLTLMTSRSIINGHKIERFLDAKSLENFVNLEELAHTVEGLPAEGLPELARALLNRALQLKAGGKPYAEVREHGDFES